jgi:hypothetical protein
MRLPGIISAACGVAIAFVIYQAPVGASWPSGGIRSVSGAMCYNYLEDAPYGPAYSIMNCPFLSDSTTYWGGSVQTIYVDYHQTHVSGGDVLLQGCWQPAGEPFISCTGATVAQSGNIDYPLSGFANINLDGSSIQQGPADQYFVQMAGIDDTIDTIYGVSYF